MPADFWDDYEIKFDYARLVRFTERYFKDLGFFIDENVLTNFSRLITENNRYNYKPNIGLEKFQTLKINLVKDILNGINRELYDLIINFKIKQQKIKDKSLIPEKSGGDNENNTIELEQVNNNGEINDPMNHLEHLINNGHFSRAYDLILKMLHQRLSEFIRKIIPHFDSNDLDLDINDIFEKCRELLFLENLDFGEQTRISIIKLNLLRKMIDKVGNININSYNLAEELCFNIYKNVDQKFRILVTTNTQKISNKG